MDSTIFCPRCGAASDDPTEHFCRVCGSPLSQPQETSVIRDRAPAPSDMPAVPVAPAPPDVPVVPAAPDTAAGAMRVPLPPVYPAAQPVRKNAGFFKGMLVGCLIPVVLIALLSLVGFFLFNSMLSNLLKNLSSSFSG